jgi:hypothetical protein
MHRAALLLPPKFVVLILLILATLSSPPCAVAAAATMTRTTRNDPRALQPNNGSADNPGDVGIGDGGMLGPNPQIDDSRRSLPDLQQGCTTLQGHHHPHYGQRDHLRQPVIVRIHPRVGQLRVRLHPPCQIRVQLSDHVSHGVPFQQSHRDADQEPDNNPNSKPHGGSHRIPKRHTSSSPSSSPMLSLMPLAVPIPYTHSPRIKAW